MRSSATVALASGTCVVGFFAGWLVFRSDGTCKVDLPPTQPLQRAEAAAAPERAPDLEKPDSRVVIQSAPVELPPNAPAAQPVASAATPAPPAPPDPRNLPESTFAEMCAKREAIQAIVNDLKRPIIKQLFDRGLFDHLSDDRAYRPTNADWDRSVISVFQSRATGCDRISIPREQHPELYLYYDETLRLDDLIYEAQRAQTTTGK